MSVQPERRFVKVTSRGPIRNFRGGMLGPILTPMLIDIAVIKAIVIEGHDIHYVNRENPSESVKITLENIRRTDEELFGVEEEVVEIEKGAVVIEREKEQPNPLAGEPKVEPVHQKQNQQQQKNNKNNRGNNNQRVEDTLTPQK